MNWVRPIKFHVWKKPSNFNNLGRPKQVLISVHEKFNVWTEPYCIDWYENSIMHTRQFRAVILFKQFPVR